MNGIKWVVSCMALVASVTSLTAGRAEDDPGTHNMMLVGEQAVYASHLPMFDSLSEGKTEYTSPHRYQVLLEVTFNKNGQDVTALYAKDRHSHPKVKMYTLHPKEFVLSRLFMPAGQPAVTSFTATVFRGHLERGGKLIPGLQDVVVQVKRVVSAEKFAPAGEKPSQLTYLLFGKKKELFLAHVIAGPPDFDQLLPVTVSGPPFTDEELARGVQVVFLDRKNTAAQRLRQGQPVTGQFHVSGAHQFLTLAVQPRAEFYFEEGELAIPPLMDSSTPEEKKAGF